MLGRYEVLRDYKSRTADGLIVVLSAGTAVNLSEEHASWVERDSPGTLRPAGADQEAAPPAAE